MTVPCNPYSFNSTHCYQAGPFSTGTVVLVMNCGVAEWYDVSTGDLVVNPVFIPCTPRLSETFTHVEVDYLPPITDWTGRGARRMKWTQTGAAPINGTISGQGTCRENVIRYVHGPCAPGNGAWNPEFNNIGSATYSWNNGGVFVWGALEGWVLVPTGVGATVPLRAASVANCNTGLETGTNPSNRVLRGTVQGSSVTFSQTVASCPCLTALGYNVAFIRGMSADGYFQGGINLLWDIGSGFVTIPQGNMIPTDGNDHRPLDARDFCADILPTKLVVTDAWRRDSDGVLFEADLVTLKNIVGSVCTTTPI